jgi:hypothetical protein
MSLSNELQIGKAGEHFACCDLIMQGYNAFLADQGLPFDIVVEKNGILKSIQVKSTLGARDFGTKRVNAYRFGTRRGKKGDRVLQAEVDYFAFVALDLMVVAYMPIESVLTDGGVVKQTVEFKSRTKELRKRSYPNGTITPVDWGRYIEDYSKLGL